MENVTQEFEYNAMIFTVLMTFAMSIMAAYLTLDYPKFGSIILKIFFLIPLLAYIISVPVSKLLFSDHVWVNKILINMTLISFGVIFIAMNMIGVTIIIDNKNNIPLIILTCLLMLIYTFFGVCSLIEVQMKKERGE